MHDDNVVFVDFGKILLDEEDQEKHEGFSIKEEKDNYDKVISIPKKMGQKMIEIAKKEAKKQRLAEKRKRLLSEQHQKAIEKSMQTSLEDDDMFDFYEEEDDI